MPSEEIPVLDPFGATHDTGLPALRAGLDPALVQDRVAHLGRVRSIRVLRLEPGRCAEVEYELESVDHASVPILATFRPGPPDRQTPDLLAELRRAGFDERGDVAVPEPLGLIPDWGAVLERQVAGVPVSGQLMGPQGVQAATRAADALVRLQRAVVHLARRYTLADELDVTRKRLEGLGLERPALRPRLDALVLAAERLADQLPPAAPRLVHRTFDPDHVRIDGARTWIIGLERASTGDPALDAGRFLAHVSELALRKQGDARALHDPERAFAQRFVESSDVAAAEALPVYSFFALARVLEATHHRLDSRPFTERLLALCEERVETLRHDAPMQGG